MGLRLRLLEKIHEVDRSLDLGLDLDQRFKLRLHCIYTIPVLWQLDKLDHSMKTIMHDQDKDELNNATRGNSTIRTSIQFLQVFITPTTRPNNA